MDIEFYRQRARERLGEGKKYYDYQQRTPSNLKLLEEYLRRLRLWMNRLNMPFEPWWQASDLASTLDPHIRTSKEVHQWVFEITQQRPYPYGVDELTFENMLHWETLKQQRPDLIAAHNLPDPYEPFILLLKRGGGFFFGEEDAFFYENDIDILHLTAGDISLLSREIHWLTRDIQNLPSPNTPLVSLDEDTLNTIDASTPKFYGFFPDGRSNFCGQTLGGDQYLIYPIDTIILIMRFSASGELIEVIEKDDPQDVYSEDHATFTANLGIHIKEMQVTVQNFFLPQHDFGIKDLPDHYVEFLEDPSAFDEDEHEEYEEMIDHWLMGGSFVLELRGRDYWLSIEGHVSAT